VSVSTEAPLVVSLLQLIATPKRFDKKPIRVVGFLRLEFEGNALYLHREDYENAISGNGIWVEVSAEMAKQEDSLNMHYVLLQGIFNANDRGHMSLWSGSIKKIRRAIVWP
jgi:hypothetical protein